MSAPTSPETTPTAAPPSVRPFDAEELAALDREDVQAGKVMARLLCFFFLYTVVVTIIAAWWTWDAIRS
ncbi:MAG TPA: hypothetical protein VF170_10585 [Planctomycetaceae bacterium]